MKKRKIIHSALSLSLTAALCLSMAACGGTQTPADSVAASQPSAPVSYTHLPGAGRRRAGGPGPGKRLSPGKILGKTDPKPRGTGAFSCNAAQNAV